MKIAVIAANGKAGQLITKEAVGRGHDVTAVVRGENRSAAGKALEGKDILSLEKADLADFDVVIDAFGAWTPGPWATMSRPRSTSPICFPAPASAC